MPSYPRYNADDAARYNARQNLSAQAVKKIQTTLDVYPSGVLDKGTLLAVLAYQDANGFVADGKIGPATYDALQATWEPETRVFDDAAVDRIVSFTVAFEGGSKDPYGAVNADGEYRGLFDKPKKDASGKRIPYKDRTNRNANSQYHKSGGSHVGISIGAWQHTQRSGGVGKVLKAWRALSEADFYAAFGGRSNAEAVYDVATAKGGGKGLRCPRTQPVKGKDLWEDPWVSRFRKASRYPSYAAAQRKVIGERLYKVVEFARDCGFTDQASFAVLFDIAVQYGVGGMRKRVRKALGSTGPYDVRDVIAALPASKRDRRYKIYRAADRWVRYA